MNNNTHITNEHSRKVSHLLRFKNQAILTTYKTINSDNPKLNCRIEGLEKFSPKKIIIDKNLKIKVLEKGKQKRIVKQCKKRFRKA